MIYTSAIYATSDESMVTGTDADGNTETVPYDFKLFRQPEHGPQGFEAAGGVIGDYVEPTPAVTPLGLKQGPSARLVVTDWEVTGVERSTGISGAFVADTDTAWVFFSDEQPDTNYIVMPADGITKYASHVEVTRPGLSEISFLIFRVQ